MQQACPFSDTGRRPNGGGLLITTSGIGLLYKGVGKHTVEMALHRSFGVPSLLSRSPALKEVPLPVTCVYMYLIFISQAGAKQIRADNL